MGFTVYYRSTEIVEPTTKLAIADSLEELCQRKSWLSCEPPGFFGDFEHPGQLLGGSKPNFLPNADKVVLAAADGLPDGNIEDVVNILSDLSARFQIDWEFSHDHDQGPIGFIRNGQADDVLRHEIIGLASIGMAMADAMENLPIQTPNAPVKTKNNNPDNGPKILKFGPVDSED